MLTSPSCFVRARRLNVIIQPHLRFVYELMKWDEVQQEKRGEPVKRELDWPVVAREIAAMNRPYSRSWTTNWSGFWSVWFEETRSLWQLQSSILDWSYVAAMNSTSMRRLHECYEDMDVTMSMTDIGNLDVNARQGILLGLARFEVAQLLVYDCNAE